MSGANLPALPSLLLVCDEFSEMLAAKPEFIDLFVQIGRIGRSIGVHLLLASQRLEEGRLRGLDTHLSYRIGLRTFSAAESRVVLGVNDAYELPNAPGHGYLKSDTQTLRRFRGAYVSGPYRSTRDHGGGSARGLCRSIVPFDVAYVPARNFTPSRNSTPSRTHPVSAHPVSAHSATELSLPPSRLTPPRCEPRRNRLATSPPSSTRSSNGYAARSAPPTRCGCRRWPNRPLSASYLSSPLSASYLSTQRLRPAPQSRSGLSISRSTSVGIH